MQESNIRIGTLFRYNKRMSIHNDVHGQVGVILSRPNKSGQYKALIGGYKTLFILIEHMEKL